jgi:hypothetical protein
MAGVVLGAEHGTATIAGEHDDVLGDARACTSVPTEWLDGNVEATVEEMVDDFVQLLLWPPTSAPGMSQSGAIVNMSA